MINRNNVVVGLLALLAAVSAIGFGLMVSRLGSGDCMSVSNDASCPVLAEVGRTRYMVAVASPLQNIESNLSPHEPIDRTNAPGDFAAFVTYRIADIDPAAVLAAPARPTRDEDVATYRLLY